MSFKLENIKAMVIAWTDENSAARKHIMYEVEGLERKVREMQKLNKEVCKYCYDQIKEIFGE